MHVPEVFKLKYRDTLPILDVFLKNPDGSAFDLTGTSGYKLHIKLNSGTTLTRTMTVPTKNITNATVANPTVLTSVGHGLVMGDIITIAGSTTTPSINGTHKVTVIDADTFSIPVNVSVGGAQAATYTVKGLLRYAWVTTDWDTGNLIVGPVPPLKPTDVEHVMEYEVTGGGGARLTFPNDGYDILRIVPDLGQA